MLSPFHFIRLSFVICHVLSIIPNCLYIDFTQGLVLKQWRRLLSPLLALQRSLWISKKVLCFFSVVSVLLFKCFMFNYSRTGTNDIAISRSNDFICSDQFIADSQQSWDTLDFPQKPFDETLQPLFPQPDTTSSTYGGPSNLDLGFDIRR